MKFLLRLYILCALGAALLPGAPAPAADLVLGMSAAFKGPSRGLGVEMYRGAMAYFAEVNAKGGVHGRKVVLKAYDDGYNPGPAIANTVRLIQKDKVFLLFGYVGTPTVTRVLPLLKRFEDRHVFLFCPFTGAEPQRQPPYGTYVFNLRASYKEETAGLVDNFVAVGRKKIAVFYQIDAYGRSGWDGVRVALARHKLRIAAEATYRRGTPFRSSMTRQVELLRKCDPDAVICIGAYAACAALVRDARDAGWDVPIANVSFVGSESMLALLRAHGENAGKDYTRHLINSQVVPSYNQTSLPAVRLYRELMKKHNPVTPDGLADPDYKPLPYSFVSLEGFLGARLVVEVLRKLGRDPRRQRVRAAAESLKDLDLGLGPDTRLSLGPKRHQALNRVYYTVVDKGRFVVLKDWKRWKK
jgi:ABC-type branched-subunit amino acid transport system substrate-binding protein